MTATVRFWWVRHGPTDSKALNGWTDVPARLDDTAQLARIAAFLPAEAPVISSDLRRAVDTAAAIAGDRPRLAPRQSLREAHFGDWEGRSAIEIHAENPTRLLALLNTPGEVAPPGGESWNALAARAGAAADALLADVLGPDLIVVAHFGVILSQIARAKGLTPRAALGQTVGHLSVTRLVHDGTDWAAELVDHHP